MSDEPRASLAVAPCIHLLGAPRLQWPDGRQQPLQRRDAALLALLAIDGPQARSRAAARVWPDADAEGARNNLRQRLFRLRRSVGRELVDGGDLLRLADGVTHDLAGSAARLAEDPLADTGELLGGLDYGDCAGLADWVEAAREHWRAQRTQVLAEAAARLEEARDHERALPFAQRLLDDNPLHEPAHRRLMRLHYLRGDRGAALAAYRALQALLTTEVQAEPEPETRALAHLIEQGGALGPVTARALPPAVLRPPRLIGRSAEWQALDTAWQEGAVALLAGEAGIGKSRLLGDFAAARGAAVGVGARPSDATVPYALVARLLRALPEAAALSAPPWARSELARLLPEWGAAPAGRLDLLRLRAAVVAVLDACAVAGTPCIVLDDLHFADAASLDALPALMAEVRDARWLLGTRPQAEAGPALAACLATLAAQERPSLRVTTLAPLDAAAVFDLVVSLELPGIDATRWAPALWRRSGGNPLFLLEMLRAWLRDDAALSAGARAGPPGEWPSPAPLVRLIQRRLDQLSAPALRLARLAALAGGDFDIELAAAVLGQHVLDLADPWRELQDAHIAGDEGFAHDLVLDATRAAVPEAVARALQAQIAEQLARRGSVPAARVAAHWQASQRWPEAAAAHEAAARQALAASRRGDELAHRRQAAEAWLAAGAPDQAFRVRIEAFEAMLLVESVAQAQAQSDELLADARDDAQRLEAHLARAQTLLMAVRPDEALAAARAARALAMAAGDQRHERRAARYVAVALAQSQRADEAVELLEPYRTGLPEAPADDEAYGFWSDFSYVLHTARRLGRSVEALQRAIAGSEARGDLAETYSTLSNLAGVMGNLGRLDEALDGAERAERLGGRLGEVAGVPAGSVQLHLGLLHGAKGHLARALGHFEAAHDLFARAGHGTWVTIASNHRCNLLLTLGQLARVQQALPPDDEAEHRPTRSRRFIIAARLEAALQRDPRPLLGQALAALGEPGDPYGRLLAEIDHLPLEPPERAIEHALALEAEARRIEYLAIGAKAGWYRVDALRRAGRAADAAALAHEALAALPRVWPWDLYLPEAWWIACRALGQGPAAADRAAAEALRSDARRWVHAVAAELPPELRPGFLQRNPANRALLGGAVTIG